MVRLKSNPMIIRHSIHTALRGIATHKSRSALTVLGIVIGITGIVLMMALGNGARELILSDLQGLGGETIVVRPGREPSGPSDIASTLFADSLKDRELNALRRKENVPEAVEIIPVVFVSGNVEYQSEIASRAQVLGASADFFARMFDIYPDEGSIYDDVDIASNAAVVVIGKKIKEELFGLQENVIGEYITIKKVKFRVVGVFPAKGQVAFFNVDNLVVVPHSTARTYILGTNHYSEFIVRAASTEVIAETVSDIEITLRDLHNITDPSKDDFFVETQQGVVDQISTIIGTLTLFLSSVVAIALVVGGIGVMNIMLVSVTERTREIGLRKAVGATDKDILSQFLLEAIFLTGIGGIIGILLGTFFAFGAALVLQQTVSPAWQFVFPYGAAALALVVSAGVGLIFGIYPAHQASKKSPIEALRYE